MDEIKTYIEMREIQDNCPTKLIDADTIGVIQIEGGW